LRHSAQKKARRDEIGYVGGAHISGIVRVRARLVIKEIEIVGLPLIRIEIAYKKLILA